MTRQPKQPAVIDAQLAVLLEGQGNIADIKTLHARQRCDVLLRMRGLRVAIVGRFADCESAQQVALQAARRHVRGGLAHIAAATVYPLALRCAPTPELLTILEKSTLRYCIVAEARQSETWSEGTAATLLDALRRTQEALAAEDFVARTAAQLSGELEAISRRLSGTSAAAERLAGILQIIPPRGETPESAHERRQTAVKVSALVLTSAFILQEQLALSNTRVASLRKTAQSADVVAETIRCWRWLREHIGDAPILRLAERVLAELPASQASSSAVDAVLRAAQAVCQDGHVLRHDLMGRIYHRVLHEAKHLGTYYTSAAAASLLLAVVLGLTWEHDFTAPRSMADFKVADLACGTGTLLMAAAQALTDRYIRDRVAARRPLDERDLWVLRQTLMQEVMHGYDVLPVAVQLSASTLALLAPQVAFGKMNLFVMPVGLDHGRARLGSLDFLHDAEVRTRPAPDDAEPDAGRKPAAPWCRPSAKVPPLDLCIMNPPFVSSRYGNRLFGSLPEDRAALQKELSRQARQLGVKATAGLGALFVPLAQRHVKPYGRIAFVLPVALATGEAWSAVRERLCRDFHLEVIIASHDAQRPSFSESTDLSELMLIARRLEHGQAPGRTVYVNLWRNPRSIHEALDSAARISSAIAALGAQPGHVRTLQADAATLGEVASLPHPVGNENWTAALFAQSELGRVHWGLEKKHELALPGESRRLPIPLCPLEQLGALGYDVRDITDAFEVDRTAATASPHAAFWNHDAQEVRSIAQEPNATLIARSAALPGRHLKDASAVWSRAGRILLVSRLWPVTHRVIAIGLPRRALGNTWWGFDDSRLREEERRALLLWLSSTLGVLHYFGRRAITRSAWMQMKKSAWSGMPVLDVRSLPGATLEDLAKAYDQLAGQPLAPIARLHEDAVRHAIDAALARGLGIPDVATLRELLAREPGLSAQDMGRPVRMAQRKSCASQGHSVRSGSP